jgi:dolichol-phosphate mannosyltransferase
LNALVIIPTYNEAQNIERMIISVLNQNPFALEVLIIDDHSPDGTAEIVKKLKAKDPRIHLIERARKLGLGTAYVAGFRYALENDFNYVLEMDADFSHDPKDINTLLEAAETYDVVIGSRYIQGVNVVNWPLSRLLLSMGASLYTRIITGLPVRDCTSGFKCYRRKVLESIKLDRIESDGYSFQIEMKFRAWKKGFSLYEVPIIFTDRVAGSSKMSKRIVREAIWMVWKLKFHSLFRRL